MLLVFAFMHLHCCISSSYARCTAHGHEGHDVGVKPEDGVGGKVLKMMFNGWIQKMEGLPEYMPE